MKQTDFKELPITARVAYCVKCLSIYIKTKYPNGKLDFIIDMACHIVDGSDGLDSASYLFSEATPEYLYEFDNFKRLSFDYMTEEQYNFFITIIPKQEEDPDLNSIMHNIYDVAMTYCYTSVPKGAKETMSYVMNTIDILKKNKLEIPSVEPFKKYKFEECNGWGAIIKKEDFL